MAPPTVKPSTPSLPRPPQEDEVREAFAQSNAPKDLLRAFWLSHYSQSLPHSTPKDVQRRIAALERDARRFAASSAMLPESREALLHLTLVATAALRVCAAALVYSGRGLGDDRDIAKAFASLEQLVFQDGTADGYERALLFRTASVVTFEPPPASATSLLWSLAAGRKLPTPHGQPLVMNEDILGPTHLTLYRNRGVQRILAPGYPPADYRWVSPNDPRVRARNVKQECYSFALSEDPSWALPEAVSADEIVRERYRPIHLNEEQARPGDLVAYYPLIWMQPPTRPDVIAGGIDHLGVVASVDANGRPERVLSKMGHRLGVYEHPVDEVPMSIGVVWSVFRKKEKASNPTPTSAR